MKLLNIIFENSHIVAPILTGFLGYAFALRRTKREQFINQVYNSQNNICSPLFYDIRKIIRYTNKNENLQILLDEFFKNYGKTDSKIYQLGERSIQNQYFILEEKYFIFKVNQNRNDWDQFWIEFVNFSRNIEKIYWDNNRTYYYHYIWMRYLEKQNIFARFIQEMISTIYEFTKTAITMFFISLGILFIGYFTYDNKLIILEWIKVVFMLLIISTMAYLLVNMVATNYVDSIMVQKERNKISLKFEKKFPNLYGKINKFFNKSFESEKKDIKIPEIKNEIATSEVSEE